MNLEVMWLILTAIGSIIGFIAGLYGDMIGFFSFIIIWPLFVIFVAGPWIKNNE